MGNNTLPPRMHANVQDLLAFTKRNEETNCLEWQRSCTGAGYGQFYINQRHKLVHRLMAQLVLPNPENKPVVMHLCDNRKCINPDHLQWGTTKENAQDCFNKGRMVIPNNKGRSRKPGVANTKLTQEQVLEIRLMDNSIYTFKQMGEMYGVTRSLIGYIRNNKIWQNVGVKE